MPRLRVTTKDGMVATFKSASAGRMQVPAHLEMPEDALPYWDDVIACRPRDSWSEVDLCHAVTLARCLHHIDRLHRELDNEADTLTDDKGREYPNPKHALLDSRIKQALSLARAIHVHANATDFGEVADKPARMKALKQARLAVNKTTDDDLIARPVQ